MRAVGGAAYFQTALAHPSEAEMTLKTRRKPEISPELLFRAHLVVFCFRPRCFLVSVLEWNDGSSGRPRRYTVALRSQKRWAAVSVSFYVVISSFYILPPPFLCSRGLRDVPKSVRFSRLAPRRLGENGTSRSRERPVTTLETTKKRVVVVLMDDVDVEL